MPRSVYVLEDAPYNEARRLGARYRRDLSSSVWEGVHLPRELEAYRAKVFSLAWWRERVVNGRALTVPEPSATQFTARPHQAQASASILEAYQKGWRGFLEADGTGLGKTLTVLDAMVQIACSEEFGKPAGRRARLLVVCPKSVIPQWRQTLLAYADALRHLDVMVVNYQRLGSLVPAATRRKKPKTAVKVDPLLSVWDLVVFDEAHSLKNYPASQVSRRAAVLAGLDRTYVRPRGDKATVTPFTVFSTATPGATPLNLAVMAGILSPLLSSGRTTVGPKGWGGFLASQRFAVTKGRNGWVWVSPPWSGKDSRDPQERQRYKEAERAARATQRRDSLRIGRALLTPGAPFIKRSPKDIAGWPEQQVVPLPLELTGSQVGAYEAAWSRFRRFLSLPPARRDPKTSLVETLRYRQKSSLLKTGQMLDFVQEQVEAGNQVYVSCEFMETIDAYAAGLKSRRIPFVEMSGRNVSEREEARLGFQRGRAQVVLCTVVAGISLHAGEILPDGSQACTRPRVTVIHDVRQDNLMTDQALGRAHRSGESSVAYFPFFQGTVDERVIGSYVNKSANMLSMSGLSLEEAESQERLFQETASR